MSLATLQNEAAEFPIDDDTTVETPEELNESEREARLAAQWQRVNGERAEYEKRMRNLTQISEDSKTAFGWKPTEYEAAD